MSTSVSDAMDSCERCPGKAVHHEPGKVARAEPCHITKFAVGRSRNPGDNLSLVDGGDVGDSVSVGVDDLIVRTAEHVQQLLQPDVGTDLLPGLADGRFCRGLADLDATVGQSPVDQGLAFPERPLY